LTGVLFTRRFVIRRLVADFARLASSLCRSHGALAAASLTLGVWLQSRPRKVQDLSKIMFPAE